MAKHLIITGRVQGVGYRQWTCHQAEKFGLRGWVRNRHDGSVEAVIDGEAAALQALIERAHHGPPAAKVDSVSVTEADGEFSRFEWRPTA